MGLLVEFGTAYDPAINTAVIEFELAFQRLALDGVIETVPTFRSLLISFDPLTLDYERLYDACTTLLAHTDWYTLPPPENRRRWVLPTVYGGARGGDIAEVADLMGVREDQVIDSHSGLPLTVAMLGFSPGLAYLGQLPELWDFPRRTTINPGVPAGAVLVAVRQTVLPCVEIPTGWRQIGQTPFRAFNALAAQPFLLAPGDEVVFEPVSDAYFDAFSMDDYLRRASP